MPYSEDFAFIAFYCFLLEEQLNDEEHLLLLRRRMQLKTRNYLTTSCLIDPLYSSWHILHRYGDNKAFLACLGVDRAMFLELNNVFSFWYEVKSGPGRSGRPPKLSQKSSVLGLLLHFYAGTMENTTLCELFGVPPSSLSRIIQKAETAFEQVHV